MGSIELDRRTLDLEAQSGLKLYYRNDIRKLDRIRCRLGDAGAGADGDSGDDAPCNQLPPGRDWHGSVP